MKMDEIDKFAKKQGLVILAGLLTWLIVFVILSLSGYSMTFAAFAVPLILGLEVFVIGNIAIRLNSKKG